MINRNRWTALSDPRTHVSVGEQSPPATVNPSCRQFTQSSTPKHVRRDCDDPDESYGEDPWASLPNKDQLAVLFLVLLTSHVQVSSLQTYAYYQLKHFDEFLSESEISTQVGLLHGCFTGTQALTAIFWTKVAGGSWCGRKRVLLLGLAGMAVCCFAYGYARTFYEAAAWRLLGGVFGGTLCIAPKIIIELTAGKQQSQALLITPIAFHLATILGSVLGGLFADPFKTLPWLFGPASVFESQWIYQNHYALPSTVSWILQISALVTVYLFFEEKSSSRNGRFDFGGQIGNEIKSHFLKYEHLKRPLSARSHEFMPLDDFNPARTNSSTARNTHLNSHWSQAKVLTLVTGVLYDFQLGAFSTIWPLFLSTKRQIETNLTVGDQRNVPSQYSGGLGKSVSTVGLMLSIMGIAGLLVQMFLCYPLCPRLAPARLIRWSLPLLSAAFFIAPYLSASWSSERLHPSSSSAFVWFGIALVSILWTTAHTAVTNSSIGLFNNYSPYPTVGFAQSVSAGSFASGAIVGARWYGHGLDGRMVAWGWRAMAAVSLLACLPALGIDDTRESESMQYQQGDEQD